MDITEDAAALAELEAVQEASEGSLLGRINSNKSAGSSKPPSASNSAANLGGGPSRKGAWAEAATKVASCRHMVMHKLHAEGSW